MYIPILRKGVQYPGAHEPLVSKELFDQVQAVLESHMNGERTRKHPHFLKGTVYCAYCGERMVISTARKPSDGSVYPYFVCAGRHSRKCPDCKNKYVLIPEVERKVEQLYDDISIPQELHDAIEEELKGMIEKEKAKAEFELDGLRRQRVKLEHKSKKLLEAHYNDAIPLELLKKEQAEIGKQLSSIDQQIKQHDMTFEEITENLSLALELLDDCGTLYRKAPDTIKRLMNQSFFEKIYISCEKRMTMDIIAEYDPPYNTILAPIAEDITKMNKALRAGAKDAAKIISQTKDRILEKLRCGLISTYPNSNFFTYKSSSKAFLVGLLSYYSNFVPRLMILRPEFLNPTDFNPFSQVSTEFTDLSYDPDCIATGITK